MQYREQWTLALRRGPGHTEGALAYWSRPAGLQIWDATPWLMPSQPLTEREILDQLYELSIEFMSRR